MISPGQLPAFMAFTWLLQAFHHMTSPLEKMACSHLLPESDFTMELCTEIGKKCIDYDKRAKVTLFRGFTHLLVQSFIPIILLSIIARYYNSLYQKKCKPYIKVYVKVVSLNSDLLIIFPGSYLSYQFCVCSFPRKSIHAHKSIYNPLHVRPNSSKLQTALPLPFFHLIYLANYFTSVQICLMLSKACLAFHFIHALWFA